MKELYICLKIENNNVITFVGIDTKKMKNGINFNIMRSKNVVYEDISLWMIDHGFTALESKDFLDPIFKIIFSYMEREI